MVEQTCLRKPVLAFLVSLLIGSYTAELSVPARLKLIEERQDRFEEIQARNDQEITTLRRALAEQTSLTNTLVASLELVKGNATVKKRRQQDLAADTVAFTAYVDHNVDHLGIDQVIPYNNVVTNIGAAFNVNTHTFVCPMSGVYFFTFVVSEIGDRELVAKLVVDGKNVIDAIANPIRIDHDQQGGNMAVVQVNKGQSVWVVNYFRNDVYLRTDENYRFASFSGVLLQSS